MKIRAILVAAAVVLATTTCADPAGTGAGGAGVASLAIRTATPPAGMLVGPNLVIEQVQVTVTRIVNDISQPVASKTVPFGIDQASANVSFDLFLAGPEDLYLDVEYQTATGQALFVASQIVHAVPGAAVAPSGALQPFYIGPGGNVAFLLVSPPDTTVQSGDTLAYSVTGFDSQQQPVPSFYVSFSTSNARIPINAAGVVRAPDLTQRIDIFATTPNGVVGQTTLTVQGSAGLGLQPDSVEKLPGGTEQFTVMVGGLRTSVFAWSVNGVDGGNATFGTVDPTGFYTAPLVLPTPGQFDVCARDLTRPGTQGCARVVIANVPSAGGDVVVFNDMNAFDSTAMQDPGNKRFVKNLVNFTTSGPRNSGTVVWFDRGRASPCFSNGECGDGMHYVLDSVIGAQGFAITRFDSYTRISAIPSNVKSIWLWNPTIAPDTAEINELKLFAGQGGRIVFVGEYDQFYGTTGLAVENQFLSDLGAQFTNLGAAIDCVDQVTGAYPRLPSSSLRTHQVTQGMNGLVVACASEAVPGPNDLGIIYDLTNSVALGGVAKISLVPLPGQVSPVRALRLPIGASTRPGVAGSGPRTE